MINNIVYISLIIISKIYLTRSYGWVPLIDLKTYNVKKPSSIQILNKELVIWSKHDQVVVQDNACIHRKAPLSEGYIDKTTNNLCCSYHGWEFDTQGIVQTIPQSCASICPVKQQLSTYQTQSCNNILWLYMPNDTSHSDTTPTPFPNHIKKYNTTIQLDLTMMEVPYSMSTLLENLFDPAHVPFAHHKLQSTRDLASDINVTLLNMNATNLDIYFEDKTLADHNYRNGTMTFHSPQHYLLTSLYPNIFIKRLHVYCVPICSHKTRIFVQNEYSTAPEHMLINAIYAKIPKFIKHIITMTFFDSDTMLLYKQEQYLRKHTKLNTNIMKNYITPTSSDKSIRFYHNWLKKYPQQGQNPTEYINCDHSNELTREQVFDRYNTHIKHCSDCQQALQVINIIQIIAPILTYISIQNTYENQLMAFLSSMSIYYVTKEMKTFFTHRDYIHNNLPK